MILFVMQVKGAKVSCGTKTPKSLQDMAPSNVNICQSKDVDVATQFGKKIWS